MASSMREGISFLADVGLYDVVLPFLLVFIIVFAVMEKSKVFGYVESEGKKFTRKNLNAMASFVIAFFVVASSRLVEIITQVSSQVVVFLFGIILLLMLYGAMQKESEDGVELDEKMRKFLLPVMLIGLILIFLNAIPTCKGDVCTTWLGAILNFFTQAQYWDSGLVGSVILFAVAILGIFYVTNYGSGSSSS